MSPTLPPALGARAARPLADAMPQRVVGRQWELLRLIGIGAVARVYQARPIGARDDVEGSYAVKLLQPPWDVDPRGLELLAREARVGRRVSHPHIVPVLAVNLDQAPYYLVMPLLRGRTAAVLACGADRPSVPVSLWIARQIADGLGALHAAGWLHADVKPSNIVIAPQGHATLIDLAFARRADECVSLADRPLAGTLHYAAPEMLTSTLRPDIRSDIYSLGVTLFELLTGRLPFDGDDAGHLAAKHRQELPGDLRVLAPHLPTHVARLVRQMLAKDPLRRPQTPQELVQRLASLEIETFAERMPV